VIPQALDAALSGSEHSDAFTPDVASMPVWVGARFDLAWSLDGLYRQPA
jgi:hypothetical protein